MISILDQTLYALYFIIFGLFIGIYLETCDYIIKGNKLNKIISIIIQIIGCFILGYLTIEYIYKITNGFVPIYIILFFGLGWFIYYKLLRKHYLKDLECIAIFFKKHRINFLVIVLPTEIFKIIYRVFKNIFIRKKNKKLM